MDFKQTKAALESFAKFVIKQSRTNLTKKKKNVTSSLYESLGYDLNVSKNSFYLEFYMDEYGAFVDEGVKGKKAITLKIETVDLVLILNDLQCNH